MTEPIVDGPLSRTDASESVQAEGRVRAALGAGGRLVDDSFARSFWVLADAEDNEVCVCTWTDRDEREE